MKKIIIAIIALLFTAGGAFIVRQNLPSKRYARHLTKARLFVREQNYTAARLEYELAFNAKGGFTPYADLEVLGFTNAVNIQEKHIDQAIANTKKYLEAHPDSKEGMIILSQLAFKAGDFETAFDAVYKAVEEDPKYFPARLLLTQVRTKQGRLDLAEEQLRYLYNTYPESVLTLLPLSENMLRQGRVKEARTYIDVALKSHPSNTSARMLLLDSYLLEANADSAQVVLDAWQKADPKLALAIQIRKAQIKSILGKYAEAEEILTPFLQPKEENLAAYFEMAQVKAKQGRYDSAVKLYSSMAEIYPGTASQPIMLSVYLNLAAQKPAKALEAIKMLQIGNKGGELPTISAVAYLALGQDAKLETLIKEQPDSLKPGLQNFLAQLDPDKEYLSQWALVNYFIVLHQAQPAAKAIFDMHTKWPKNTLASTLWSGQLASQGKYAEAAKLLETVPNLLFPQQVTLLSFFVKARQKDKVLALGNKLLEERPKQRGLNLFMADFYAAQQDKTKANLHYEKELSIDSSSLVALNNLSWEYGVVQGNLEKAMPYLERLKSQEMLDPRILDTIGWILAKNGKGEEAAKYLHSALNLVPDHPGFNYHMAFAMNQLGKKDEAKKYLNMALASKLSFDERKDAEKLQAELG